MWELTRDNRDWGGKDPPAVVFIYAGSRAGSRAMAVLHGFDGTLHLDGYAGYEGLRGIVEPYAIEDEIRGKLPEGRRAVRNGRSATLIDEFRIWQTQK